MKSMLLVAALPAVLLTGCAGSGYVGTTGPGYPGYYDGYGSPDYYDGGPTYIGFSTYNRGYYHHNYNHEGGRYHQSAIASRGVSRSNGGGHFASAGHRGGGHSGAASHASASVGGGRAGGHSGGGAGGHH